MESEHQYLKVPEVAKLLRVPRSRAYEMVGQGAIPGTVRIGRSIRIDRRILCAWLDEQAASSAGDSK